jgi:hypothetical protein
MIVWMTDLFFICRCRLGICVCSWDRRCFKQYMKLILTFVLKYIQFHCSYPALLFVNKNSRNVTICVSSQASEIFAKWSAVFPNLKCAKFEPYHRRMRHCKCCHRANLHKQSLQCASYKKKRKTMMSHRRPHECMAPEVTEFLVYIRQRFQLTNSIALLEPSTPQKRSIIEEKANCHLHRILLNAKYLEKTTKTISAPPPAHTQDIN